MNKAIEMSKPKIYTATQKELTNLSMEAVLRGQLNPKDFLINSDTLISQAETAENAGYEHLGQNLRRASELTKLSNEEILEIYDTLRPGRTSYEKLIILAERLENDLTAPLTANLVREAAAAYMRRGLIQAEKTET
jgi:propanediol dehydratase small subunit